MRGVNVTFALAALALLLHPSTAATPFRTTSSLVLSSSQASYVVDLDHGCSISAAWAAGDASKTNLINTADLGRYVQVDARAAAVSFPRRSRVQLATCRRATTRDLLPTTAAPGAASPGLGVRRLPHHHRVSAMLIALKQTRFPRETSRATQLAL